MRGMLNSYVRGLSRGTEGMRLVNRDKRQGAELGTKGYNLDTNTMEIN